VKELRCAFVGCGGVAAAYLEVYRDCPGVRVSVCIDIDLERARLAARIFDESKKSHDCHPALVSTDFSDALAPEIDLVVINTPNYLHREQAVAALQLNKHVFLQKPLASTLEEAVAILEAERESQGKAGVYMSYFDLPVMHDFHQMAACGWFGEITQMHASLMHTGGLLWDRENSEGMPSWRGSVRLTGGGAFIQLAVHYLRVMCWMIDDRVTRITGFAANLECAGLEGEDTAVALLEFEGGVQATLNISWCATGEQFSIQGTKGSMTYLDNQLMRLQSEQDFTGHTVRYSSPDIQYVRGDSMNPGDSAQSFNQHCKFIEAIRCGQPAFVSVESAVQDIAVVEAFYESVRTGRSISPFIPFASIALEHETGQRSGR